MRTTELNSKSYKTLLYDFLVPFKMTSIYYVSKRKLYSIIPLTEKYSIDLYQGIKATVLLPWENKIKIAASFMWNMLYDRGQKILER